MHLLHLFTFLGKIYSGIHTSKEEGLHSLNFFTIHMFGYIVVYVIPPIKSMCAHHWYIVVNFSITLIPSEK